MEELTLKNSLRHLFNSEGWQELLDLVDVRRREILRRLLDPTNSHEDDLLLKGALRELAWFTELPKLLEEQDEPEREAGKHDATDRGTGFLDA